MVRPDEEACNRVIDRLADGYGYDIDATFSGRVKLELLQRYVKPGHRVLDVGCANGIHMRALAAQCSHITGVDMNARMLDLARARLEADGIQNFTLEQRSAAALGFSAESFDLVYSLSTLLLVPDTVAAIREMVGVLRRGGIAIVDIAGRHNLSYPYWNRYWRRHGHFGINTFREQEIRDLIAAAGLEPLEQHAFGVLDQWKCIPVFNRIRMIDRLFHNPQGRDWDYTVSNTPPLLRFAARWYIAARKRRP
jgi:ubiquinone/menaquinone biosynthesis C-methylase UbiE